MGTKLLFHNKIYLFYDFFVCFVVGCVDEKTSHKVFVLFCFIVFFFSSFEYNFFLLLLVIIGWTQVLATQRKLTVGFSLFFTVNLIARIMEQIVTLSEVIICHGKKAKKVSFNNKLMNNYGWTLLAALLVHSQIIILC